MTQELKDERGAWDGDSQESRTAFRNYDTIAEPVSRKTPWQIWRDACAWQARAALNASETNQCDGCRTGAPVSERGNHLMPDGGYMGCTKDRYTSERQSTMALAKARSALYSIAKTYDDEELRTRALEAYEATFDAARAAQPPAAIVNAQEKRIVYTRPAPANKAVGLSIDPVREKLIELADELDGELDGGATWTKAQHTCCSVSGALRALSATQPSAEAMTDDARRTLGDAITCIIEAADGIKNGCAIGDEWPDEEDKDYYDRLGDVISRLNALLAAAPAEEKGEPT
jgi:hypothetical protein